MLILFPGAADGECHTELILIGLAFFLTWFVTKAKVSLAGIGIIILIGGLICT